MPFLLEGNLGQQIRRVWDHLGFCWGGKAEPGPSPHPGQEQGRAGHQGSPSPWHHTLPGHGLRPQQDTWAGPAWWDSMTRQGSWRPALLWHWWGRDQLAQEADVVSSSWECEGKPGRLDRDHQCCQYLRAQTLACAGQSKGRQALYGCCCAASHVLCLSFHLP